MRLCGQRHEGWSDHALDLSCRPDAEPHPPDAARSKLCQLPGSHEVALNNMPLSTNLFGHGSEKMGIDLRAGSATMIQGAAGIAVGLRWHLPLVTTLFAAIGKPA
jgi:hypothetical protein